MKTKLTLPIIIIVAVAFLAGILYLQGASHTKPNLSVQRIGDRGLFVGDSTKNPFAAEPYDHQKAIRVIDDAWDNITLGETSAKVARYEDAAMAFKRAYDIGGNSRALSGLRLAETYQKLGRYDDGITLLDNMIKNHELSEKGIQNANEIKSRLLRQKEGGQVAAKKRAGE